jgi:hypothetical protein
MNKEQALAKTSELILDGLGRSTFTAEEIDYAKSLYEEVMAIVPESSLAHLASVGGTIDSKRQYVTSHPAWSMEDPSRQEMMIYREQASTVAHYLNDTLGLRD